MVPTAFEAVHSGLGIPVQWQWFSDDLLEGRVRRLAPLVHFAPDRGRQERQLRSVAKLGFCMPRRHKKRRRLYHKDSSVIRLRPTHPNHIWAVDFVYDKLSNGRPYRILTLPDEYALEALCVAARPKMNVNDVLGVLHRLLMKNGKLESICSDNGPAFIATPLQEWFRRVGIQPMQIFSRSPSENGYNECFTGTMRREVLNAEWFQTTKQAQVAINAWLRQYNKTRPHHALNMRPPIPDTLLEKPQITATENGG